MICEACRKEEIDEVGGGFDGYGWVCSLCWEATE